MDHVCLKNYFLKVSVERDDLSRTVVDSGTGRSVAERVVLTSPLRVQNLLPMPLRVQDRISRERASRESHNIAPGDVVNFTAMSMESASKFKAQVRLLREWFIFYLLLILLLLLVVVVVVLTSE